MKLKKLLLVLLLKLQLVGAQEKAREAMYPLSDMIPLLKETHDNIYIDNTLFGMDVVPYSAPIYPEGTSPSQIEERNLLHVLMYLGGIATANNLDFKVDGINLYLKGGDFPDAGMVSLGFLDPETKEQFDKLQWDVINVAGKYLVEVPTAHKPYLEELRNHARKPYQLEFIIVTSDDNMLKQSGLSVGSFVDLNLNAFDSIYNGDLENILSITKPRAGFRLGWSPSLLENTLNEAITTSLSGLIGETSEILIADRIPYKVNEVTNDGLRINSRVEFVDAGFRITIRSAYIQDRIIFDFDIENSSADFARQVDGLPVIRRRQFKSRKMLNPLESIEIARMETKSSNDRRSGLPFLKKFKSRSNGTETGTVSVLVRRTL